MVVFSIHQQYPSYSATVRLTKRWVSAQLLASFLPDTALELLTAHVFLHPAPYHVTASPLTGFLRVLRLLATHDWKSSPLIVNLNGELSSEFSVLFPPPTICERIWLLPLAREKAFCERTNWPIVML